MSLVPACIGIFNGSRQTEGILQSALSAMGLGVTSARIRTCIVRERTSDDQRRTRRTEGPDVRVALRIKRRTNRSIVATTNQGILAADAWMADTGRRTDSRRFINPCSTLIISVM